jgi:hypothetical protein
VITLADVSTPPPIQIYPVPDQIADKVCAMYTRYGTLAAPSGRFHDLVDLMLITSSCQIDAAELSRSLTQQAAIRDLQLPAELQPPGPAWTGGYSRAAEQARTLSAELRRLAAALAAAGRCPTAPLPVGPMASMAPTNSHFGEPHVGDDVRSRGTCEPQISSHRRVIVWCSNRASDGNAILLLTPDVSQSGSDGRHSSWTYRNRGVRDVVGSTCLSRVRERPS